METIGSPAAWLGFTALVLVLLVLDLAVFHRKAHTVRVREALGWTVFWIALAMAFNAFIYVEYGSERALEFLTAYLLEKALSVDNLFVFLILFASFKVPAHLQHRVLFWGILGAIIFRAIFISLGATVVNSWTWVLYIFAAFLIWTGWKMVSGHGQEMKLEDNKLLAFVRARMRVTDRIENHNFFVRRPDPQTGKAVLFATPLFLALIMVEAADIIFAVDSVPAIFAVTRDPFIVYTSNIFAILGLRSMYFMLAAAVERFKYLKYGLSLVLVLIGAKIIWNFGLSKELGWVPYLEPHWALLITIALIGGAMMYSLYRTRDETLSSKR